MWSSLPETLGEGPAGPVGPQGYQGVQGPEGSQGAQGVEGTAAFVSAVQDVDTASGTITAGVSYPTYSAAIISVDVTTLTGDYVLVVATGTENCDSGSGFVGGTSIGLSFNGGAVQPCAASDSSSLGQAISTVLTSVHLFGPLLAGGTFTVAAHISSLGGNGRIYASSSRPLRIQALVIRS